MAAKCPGVGARVRVLDSHRTAERRGMTGTVEKLWGDPSHPAVDVLLDEGGLRLFWHHELEEVAPAPPSRRRPLLRGAGVP